jgi:hypothetical protein
MLSKQLRQFDKNGGNALGLITREQFATPKSAKKVLFEIHVGKGLPISVLHHKAAIQFLDGPRRREVPGFLIEVVYVAFRLWQIIRERRS